MIGSDLGTITAVCAGLFVFGFVYNMVVAWVERNDYDEGYTWLLVVIGVAVTLGGVALIDWRAAVLALAAFSASGFWMAAGSVWRHWQLRKRSQEAYRKR